MIKLGAENYEAIVYALSNQVLMQSDTIDTYKEYTDQLKEFIELQKKDIAKFKPADNDIEAE